MSRSICTAAGKGFYEKDLTKWWGGYDFEEYVIIEDLTPASALELAPLLTRWSDRFIIKVEVKGGSMTIRPKLVVISSTYSLEECFKNTDYLSAMERRFPDKRIL